MTPRTGRESGCVCQSNHSGPPLVLLKGPKRVHQDRGRPIGWPFPQGQHQTLSTIPDLTGRGSVLTPTVGRCCRSQPPAFRGDHADGPDLVPHGQPTGHIRKGTVLVGKGIVDHQIGLGFQHHVFHEGSEAPPMGSLHLVLAPLILPCLHELAIGTQNNVPRAGFLHPSGLPRTTRSKHHGQQRHG
jgi:hypothetical protein